MDTNVVPARGQTVLVRNEAEEMCDNSGTDDGSDEVCYVMQRAAGELVPNPFRKRKTLRDLRWWYPIGRLLPEGKLGLFN